MTLRALSTKLSQPANTLKSHVARVAAVILGGSSLVLGLSPAANAQTVTKCWFGTSIPGLNECSQTTLTVGDKTISNITLGSQNPAFPVPFTGSGTGNFTILGDGGPDWSDDEFAFTLQFDPILSSPPIDANTPFGYAYLITINDPLWVFDDVALEADSANAKGATTNVIKVGGDFANPPNETFALLNDNGTSIGPRSYTFIGDYKQVAIADVFTLTPVLPINPNGEIAKLTSITNTYTQRKPRTTVPGPLPLFGAAMAFGFSRQLRNRIKVHA